MTRPDSIVGIVAVDKSVNLMNVSNDITMENVSLAIFFITKTHIEREKKETLHIGIYDPLLPVRRLLSVLLTVFVQSFKVYEEPFRNL